ncbi:MAG: hypothetical protein HWN79_01950 [Candidatus Lokiarchaeota archaeon]|nr:hypothetical protein [Candidatus Lokiarchaeota archaeon]
MKQNKISKAKSCLDTVKNILCKDIELMLDKSNLLYEMGKTEESIECINIALKLKPNDINLLNKKEEILNQFSETNFLT